MSDEPETRTFEIWREGYRATDSSEVAELMDSEEGRTFSEACANCFSTRPDAEYFDPVALTYWGCCLFDNEAEARKAFG